VLQKEISNLERSKELDKNQKPQENVFVSEKKEYFSKRKIV
jgi:hypothetical protein